MGLISKIIDLFFNKNNSSNNQTLKTVKSVQTVQTGPKTITDRHRWCWSCWKTIDYASRCNSCGGYVCNSCGMCYKGCKRNDIVSNQKETLKYHVEKGFITLPKDKTLYECLYLIQYDNDGYDQAGYDKYGYDKHGYNVHGYNNKGFNKYGYDKFGFDKDGYNKEGYDRDGYNKNGYNRSGVHKNRIDVNEEYRIYYNDVIKLLNMETSTTRVFKVMNNGNKYSNLLLGKRKNEIILIDGEKYKIIEIRLERYRI